MRHCLSQPPFKYFIETDPTVPKWVKDITEDDIANWNNIVNKQNTFNAGRALTFDGNTLNFDYYINTGGVDSNTLLTKNNIINLCNTILYDKIQSEFATAIDDVVTNEIQQYVTGRISALNLSNYATTTALTNLSNKFDIRDSYYNDKIARIGELSSTREYLITTGNGLKKTYVNEGTLNQVAKLDLDIRRLPDGYLNEEVKKYLHLENGYNGFYIFNDLIYQDWKYVLDDNGDYISDGQGGWQKEQLDHYILGMPFTQRLVPAKVAVSSQAVLEELNDNYEMKLISLGGNIQIVDLAYYKQLWGATGATFTEQDFKDLTREWYDVNWDYDTPENQAIMKMYTYNGENGDRLYRHQRAITFVPSETSDIYAADVYTAISNPTESQFNNRTEPWYTYDSVSETYVYVSESAEFDSNATYYTLGSQQSKYSIPSCDGVAKFVESLDLGYSSGKLNLSVKERPETINERTVNIDEVTIVDDSVTNTSNPWSGKKVDDTIKALDAEVTSSDGTNVQVKVTEANGVITGVNITTDNTINLTNLQTALTNYIQKSNTTGLVKNDGTIDTNTYIPISEETTFNGSIVGGKMYKLSTAISSLTVTSIATSNYESNIFFTTAASLESTFLTLPSNTKVIGDVPTWETSKSYVMSVLNGIVVFGEIDTLS